MIGVPNIKSFTRQDADYPTDPAVRLLTCEIIAHQVVLGIVLLPLNLLLVPIFSFQSISGFLQSWATPHAARASVLLADLIEGPLFAGIATAALLLTISATAMLRARRQLQREASQFQRKYLEPAGKKGAQLQQLIQSLWRDALARRRPPPEVRWFPKLNVSARALVIGQASTIAVSAGLWERAVHKENDPLVRIILLHEMAHLAYRDISVFRWLVLCAHASRIVLYSLFWTGMAITAMYAVAELANFLGPGVSLWALGGRLATVAVIGGLHFGTAPLTDMLIQRYIGFITALMELRADVVASSKAGGLEKAGRTMETDPTIYRSGVIDLGRSLVSLSLSHLPERERSALLRNRQRLLSPKLRYFSLSVVLSILQPLNGAVFAYFPQQLALLSVGAVATAQISAAVVMFVQMPLAGVRRVSAMRTAIVAAAVTIAAACSQIDFERTTVASFVYSELAAFPPPGDGQPVSDVISAALGAASLILREFCAAAFSWTVLFSTVVTALILRCLSAQGPQIAALRRGYFWPIAILALCAVIGSLTAVTVSWPILLFEQGYSLPVPRFSLGPFLALLACFFLRAFSVLAKITSRAIPPSP
jgi:Zn-dependent protease with chaperone function/heme/copper-type cytochrome/quinol oxidase subunit 4